MHPAKILATGRQIGYEFVYKWILLRDWAVKRRIIVPFLRHTLADNGLSLDSGSEIAFRCVLKGAFKGCVPHQRPCRVYIPRSVTDIDHKPRMHLSQPQRWIPRYVTSTAWAIIGNEAAFTAPAKILTTKFRFTELHDILNLNYHDK